MCADVESELGTVAGTASNVTPFSPHRVGLGSGQPSGTPCARGGCHHVHVPGPAEAVDRSWQPLLHSQHGLRQNRG